MREQPDLDAALYHAQTAIELNPEDVGLLFNRALIFRELGDLEAARADFAAFLERVEPGLCPECEQEAQDFLNEMEERGVE